MAASSHRSSATVQNNVNLYCAQCESQIGIFENEWIRLTSSYGRSKERGIHFATEIGNRTQVVPSGPAQRSAEGCVMAEVFCRKCSNMVGQYCKSAPDAEKQPLVDQYFYKFSRTFLKESRTNARVNPVFGYGSDIVKPVGSRSSVLPRTSMVPTSRWANTPMRQSSRTPAISTHGSIRSSIRRGSQEPPMPYAEVTDDRWQKSSADIKRLQEEVGSQRSTLQEQLERIFAQAIRLDDQETRLRDQESSIEEHENCLSAQATRIVEQDEVIKIQTKRLEMQQQQLATITNQLSRLQKTMDDLRTTLVESRTNSFGQPRRIENEGGDFDGNPGKSSRNAQSNQDELTELRTQNQAMKSRLNSIASAIGGTVGTSSDTVLSKDMSTAAASSSAAPNVIQTLGKRKREEAGRLPSLELGGSASVRIDGIVSDLGNTRQMPTPQASDGGQRSPGLSPPNIANRTTGSHHDNGRSRRKTKDRIEDSAETSEVPRNMSSRNGRDSLINKKSRLDLSSHDQIERSVATKVVEGEPVLSGGKDSSSAVARRKRGRLSRSSNAAELINTEDEASILDVSNIGNRRVTRASTRAMQPLDTDAAEQHQDEEPEQPSPNSAVSCMQIDEATQFMDSDPTLPLSPPILPSVQTASSVLGITLEALIESSQALKQDTTPQPTHSDPALDNDQTATKSADPFPPKQVQNNDPHSLPSLPDNTVELVSNASEAVNDIMGEGVSNNVQEKTHDNRQLQFVQDSGIYDLVDSSDDDDDLIQPNAYLYGNDSDVVETISSSERTNPAILDVNDGNYAQHIANHAISRDSRSLAPEPSKIKKPTRPIKKYVTLDVVHIATPKLFTEAYATGRQPKAVRPTPVPTRERVLNDELMLLGLSNWIGKNKKTKEYRQAVSVARENFRNYNKATYLWSLGLDNNASGPSSSLPVDPSLCSETVVSSMPLSVIENAPGLVSTMGGNTQTDDAPASNEALLQEQPRATRARARRSSVPSGLGLDETETRAAEPELKQVPRTRKSEARRKSQGKSGLNADEVKEANNASQVDINQDDAPTDGAARYVAPAVADSSSSIQEPVSKRLSLVGKPRGRPRKSVPSGTLADADAYADTSTSLGAVSEIDDSGNTRAGSTQAPAPVPQATEGRVAMDKSQIPRMLSPKSQAKRREEAIVLRDRMAKELMESEDMEM